MAQAAQPTVLPVPETIGLGERLAALHRQILREIPQVDRIGCALYDPGEDLLKTFVNSTLAGEALRYGKPGLDNPHFVASGLD